MSPSQAEAPETWQVAATHAMAVELMTTDLAAAAAAMAVVIAVVVVVVVVEPTGVHLVRPASH